MTRRKSFRSRLPGFSAEPFPHPSKGSNNVGNMPVGLEDTEKVNFAGPHTARLATIAIVSSEVASDDNMPLLPLFPLNTVLFPGMPISLHIFEDRYKLMVERCITERRPFGVVLLRQGTAEYQPGQKVVPYEVGCTAMITQMQPVGMGRMNIVAVGQERFQIETFDYSEPFLMGQVSRYDFEPYDAVALHEQGRALRPWVLRYLHSLIEGEQLELDLRQLPNEALPLAYLTASLLKISMQEKQRLLTERKPYALLERAKWLCRKEIALSAIMKDEPDDAIAGVFSVN
jgi:Lon protease-like protein